MKKSEAEKRVKKLKEKIRKHRYAYHVLDKKTISEDVLDSLKKELFNLEERFPETITPDSPTQRVGGKPLKKFKKVRHITPMLSLNDVFDSNDLENWIARLENYLGRSLEKSEKNFYCDLKMDGLAVELVYLDGALVRGSTRGDGTTGEDVTQNIRTIEAIPLRLERAINIVVRGEIFLSKKEFKRINKEREKDDKALYANPRNVAAGSIRQLNPKITAARRLDFFAYGISPSGNDNKSTNDYLELFPTKNVENEALKDLGIKTNPNIVVFRSMDEVIAFHDNWESERDDLEYEIDGVVVSLNNNKLLFNLGYVGKAPRGAVAFKFSPKEATTRVVDIKIHIGRTGAVTPVAILEPINVGGITITHASLHNKDQVDRLDLRIGDTVVVSRAGDVIPQITNVMSDMRVGREKRFTIPNKCPIDGSKIVKDGAMHKCSNPECGARSREQLYHFVSKPAFNIIGLGPKILDRFLDEGLISDFPDLFELEVGDIAGLDQFGDKSAKNITEELKTKKRISLDRFLYSLGILHVGAETATFLARQIAHRTSQIAKPTDVLEAFKKLSIEDLQQIPDIGPKVAGSIYNWFRKKRNARLLKRLSDAGITIFVEKQKRGAKFHDLNIAITGTLRSMTRDEAKDRIETLGGKVTNTVSSSTNYLVLGDDPGLTKIKDADKHKTKQINEAELIKLLED